MSASSRQRCCCGATCFRCATPLPTHGQRSCLCALRPALAESRDPPPVPGDFWRRAAGADTLGPPVTGFRGGPWDPFETLQDVPAKPCRVGPRPASEAGVDGASRGLGCRVSRAQTAGSARLPGILLACFSYRVNLSNYADPAASSARRPRGPRRPPNGHWSQPGRLRSAATRLRHGFPPKN